MEQTDHKIDDIDLKILGELYQDSRQSYRELSEKMGMPEGTLYKRVSRLRDSGVLKRFTIDLDYTKLGYEITALISIRVDGQYLVEVENQISKDPGVMEVYDITGDFDALVIAKFKTREDLNALVKKIIAMPHVKRTSTTIALNIVKEEHWVEGL
jgi:Lrp/AsnC family transcriptional regulator for asnA, asnC and gidA